MKIFIQPIALDLNKFKTLQKWDYDCGVAVMMTILCHFGKDYMQYSHLKDMLNTTVPIGTTPESMQDVLNFFNLKCDDGLGSIGFILFNTELLYGVKTEDSQNGHWCFYTKQHHVYTVVDVWSGINKPYTKKEILTMTKNVKVGNKIYNDYIKSVTNLALSSRPL